MHTFATFGRRNWFFLSLLVLALLLPVGSPGFSESAPNSKSPDGNKASRSELGQIQLLKQERYRPTLYSRRPEMQVGTLVGAELSLGQMSHPRAVILPNGAFLTDSRPIHAQIQAELHSRGLVSAGDGQTLRSRPDRFEKGMHIVQFDPDVVRRGRAFEELEATGARISHPIPQNAVMARIDSAAMLDKVMNVRGVVHVERYYAANKLSRYIGREAYANRHAAEADTFNLDVSLFSERLLPEQARNFQRFVEDVLKADYVYGEDSAGPGSFGRAILHRVSPSRLDLLAKNELVHRVTTAQGYFPLAASTAGVVQAGHSLNNLAPFFGLGIDGSSQYVAITDDGVSVDSYPFAHADFDAQGNPTNVRPDLNSANDTDPLARPDVGPTHRKIESYRTVSEINSSVGRTGSGGSPAPGAGDFQTCDSPFQGSSTHGQIVAAVALGNPSAGSQGLRITRDNTFLNQGFFQNDIPFDGVARGARLIFQDGHTTPAAQIACFSAGDSNVNVGTPNTANTVGGLTFGTLRGILHEAAFRLDLLPAGSATNTANWIPNARGARVHVIPFGVPNFDTVLTNGHDAYNNDTNDVDDFAYRNRESLVVLAVGNDGSDRAQSFLLGGLEVFPNASNRDTYQVAVPATAKNGLVVGSHTQDAATFSIQDDVENQSDFSSKGPATFASRRVAPLVLAPGSDGVNTDYSQPNFASMAAFRSNDNDQAGPIGGLTDFDGDPTDYIDEYNTGTSFAAAGAGGAAALVRDYFLKGFYPTGSQRLAGAPTALSGQLVKAALIASANYEDLDLKLEPGTVASIDRFNNAQGYGRIQLVNALPLANYPEALLPDPKIHAESPGTQPTTPLGILAVDEYFDGGQGLGVIINGATNTYTVNVIDRSRELRVALAWADVPGDLLVHNLDLVVVAPAVVDTDGIPDGPTCATTGGCAPLTYNGNQFLADFSVDTRISSGAAFAQACNTAVIGRDACNPTEAVILSASKFVNEDDGLRPGLQGATDQVSIVTLLPTSGRTFLNIGPSVTGTDYRVTFLGEGDGVLNSETSGGLNNAICAAYQATNADVLALCSTPRDLNANGSTTDSEDFNGNSRLDTIDGVPAGSWQIRVFARNAVTTTPVRNAPAGVAGRVADTVNSPGTGFNYPANTRPFALLAAGGFLSPGTSRAGLDRSIYDCADSAVARVYDGGAGITPGSVSSATTVEVRRPGVATPIDTESGLQFSAVSGISGAFQARALSVSRSRTSIAGNGVLDVDNGDSLALRYTGGGGSDSLSRVDCAPTILATPLSLFGPNYATFVAGGCDNDRFFDAGEMVSYTVNLQNIKLDTFAHQDVQVALICTNPAGNPDNPCQHIQILNSPARVGTLLTAIGPEGLGTLITGQQPTFNIFVKPTVSNVAPANRQIDLSVVVQSATQDQKVTQQEPVVLTFRHSVESDLEAFHYSTDYPNGTANFVLRDLDRDGAVRPPLNPRLSEPGVGQILGTTLVQGNFALSELAQETQKFSPIYAVEQNGAIQRNVQDITPSGEPVGFDIFDPPFDFDSQGNAASEGFTAIRSPLSRPGSGPPPVEWFHTQNGVCGFQTQQSGRAGVWHAGGNPTGLAFSAPCPAFTLPGAADGIDGNQFINDALLTPAIQKVNQVKDALGFDFTARLTRFSWNENVEFTNQLAQIMGHIDNNLDLDSGVDLLSVGVYGEQSIYQFQQEGAITASNNLNENAHLQTTFGPLHDPDGSTSRSGGGNPPVLTNEEVGISRPLPTANTLLSRFLLPYPARDADLGTAAFDSLPQDRSTPAGPVRNRETSLTQQVVPGFEDFWGPTGNRFQAALTWFIREDSGNIQAGYGWSVDDLVLEWDESHPKSQTANSGSSCSRIGFSEDVNQNGQLDAGEDTGLDGVAGTGDFGEGDGRITSNGAGAQCASIAVDRGALYDCNTSLDVTVQDLTPPDVYDETTGTFCRNATTGRFTTPCGGQLDAFIIINARTISEPRGEEFRLNSVPGNPFLFRGQVPVSSVVNLNDASLTTNRGNVYIRPSADTGINPAPLIISYQDLHCDSDADGTLAEDNFRDIDGDGVTNFDNNFDARPDDNCFIGGGDTFNSAQENDAFGKTGDALRLCNTSADCGTGGGTCICPDGFTQCVIHVCSVPLATSLFLGEYIDTDGTRSYTPIEDRALGTGSGQSFNGVLDPGEDVGINLIADAGEALLGPDGQPGVAGFDDDKDIPSVIDENDEIGWCGSDDRAGDNFRTDANLALGYPNSCPGGTELDGKLQGDLADQPDPFGDICDNCPLFNNPAQIDDDNDGVATECEDNDLDRDGVVNTTDNCPTIFNPLQEDGDTDGRGTVCDKEGGGPDPDFDQDGVIDPLDNCPRVKNGNCTNADPLVSLAHCDADADGTLEPDEVTRGFQRDLDFDAIGDACDPEDFDIDIATGQPRPDGVTNAQDNCPTVYNPRNSEGVQEDTDGDGQGDSRASSGFAACDPDSTDDDNDGNPDDLVSFGLTVACNTRVGGNLGSVSLRSISIDDCNDAGDPTDDHAIGDCDGIADPGEQVLVRVTIFNGLSTPLTNVRVGLGSTSDSVACVIVGEADYDTVGASQFATNAIPFEFAVTTGDAAQLRTDIPIGEVLREPKRAVFTVSVRSNEVAGTLATQTFALNLDLNLDPNGIGQSPFTYFESFENEMENSSLDPRDLNGNQIIDCGSDGDCNTVTDCSAPSGLCTGPDGSTSSPCCDEWTLPLDVNSGLRLENEAVTDPPSGTLFPPARGEAQIVGAGSRLICPADANNGAPVNGVRADALDWHVHTRLKADITGTNTTARGDIPKAFRGENSLHWGRHVLVPNVADVTFGDTYCLQCINAFVMSDAGFNLNNVATPEQPLRLSFWHINEACDHECYFGFGPQTSDDGIAIVEARADLDFGPGTSYGPWERLEPTINPYDGQQDTAYYTVTYEPPDDTNPLNQVDKETTMCAPLFVYNSVGSAKGTDSVNCTDGDSNGFLDCGYLAARTNPAERRLDRISRGAAGVGVWAFTTFDLERYAGRHVQLRWITTNLDGLDVFTSYLETTGGPFNDPAISTDDGWYVDDVRLSGLVQNELIFTVDPENGAPDGGLASCPTPGGAGEPACSIAGAGVTASPTASNSPGSTVSLTATGVGINCSQGETRYRWLRNGVEVQPLSTDNTLVDGPQNDATYTVEIRCSSITACTANASTTVRVYDGGTGQSIALRWRPTTQDLAFNAVQQLDITTAGQFPGYDVFCGTVRPSATPPAGCSGAGLTATAAGSGIAGNYGSCFAPNLPQSSPGAEILVPGATSALAAPSGNALFLLAGHGQPTPNSLGFTSNQKLRKATVSCP